MNSTDALAVLADHAFEQHGQTYCRYCWRVLTGKDPRIAHCGTCDVVQARQVVAQEATYGAATDGE